MALFQESGGTAQQRYQEALRLLEMLAGCDDLMTEKERQFVVSMLHAELVSPKQLFWLRDLKEKYAE